LAIRYWAAIVTALATAALVDFSSELLANAGWLGSGASDGHQEGVLPVVMLAALIAVGLGITVALRAGRGEQTRYRDVAVGGRILMAVAGLAVAFIIIAMMEAYEIRFGGLSALDPRSVFAEHWPAVTIGYVVIASLVSAAVNALLRVAVAAGKFAAHVVVAFLRLERRTCAALLRSLDSLGKRILYRALPLERGALAPRAPPPLQLLHPQQLVT
jgi:hypothetical protein